MLDTHNLSSLVAKVRHELNQRTMARFTSAPANAYELLMRSTFVVVGVFVS